MTTIIYPAFQKERALRIYEIQAKQKAILESLGGPFTLKFPVPLIVSDYQVKIEEINQIHSQILNGKKSKDRAGNNVAQNSKKSYFTTLKQFLPLDAFKQFEDSYVPRYKIKSQKENIVVISLILHKFCHEKKINSQLLQKICDVIQSKLNRYVKNSNMRCIDQPERKEFHETNAKEFQKLADFELNYSLHTQTLSEITQKIKNLYIRKKSVHRDAIRRIRYILEENPELQGLFPDYESFPQPIVERSSSSADNIEE